MSLDRTAADEPPAPDWPPRLAEALGIVRAAIAHCERRKIPVETILGALMTEVLPRLVATYGPHGVSSVLGRLAGEIAAGGPPPIVRQ